MAGWDGLEPYTKSWPWWDLPIPRSVSAPQVRRHPHALSPLARPRGSGGHVAALYSGLAPGGWVNPRCRHGHAGPRLSREPSSALPSVVQNLGAESGKASLNFFVAGMLPVGDLLPRQIHLATQKILIGPRLLLALYEVAHELKYMPRPIFWRCADVSHTHQAPAICPMNSL